MLKILLITLDFPPKSYGGVGIYAGELARILAQNNEVHVIAPATKTTTEKLQESLYIHWQKSSFLTFLKLPTFLLQVRKNIDNIIKKYNIQVLHSNDVEGCLQLKKLPSVVTIQHLAKFNFSKISIIQNIRNFPYIFMEKIAIRNASRIITTSHSNKRDLLEHYKGIKEKIIIINIPIDYKRFKNKDNKKIKENYNLEKEDLIFLCPGLARQERKGGTYLVKALQKLNKELRYKCLITGKSREGKWGNKLLNEVRKRGLQKNIIFTGEIEFKQIIEYYAACDIVIYPSIFEGYGIPVLEAMAAQKPVIATRTGEIPYFIRNMINGVLVNPKNSEEIYKALNLLIENKKLREKIGMQARIDIEDKLNADIIRKKFENVYKSILA